MNLVSVSVGLHVSILVYIFVLFFLGNTGGWPAGWHVNPENRILLFALSGLSIVIGLLAVGLPFFMKKKLVDASTPSSSSHQESNLILNFQTPDAQTQSITIIRMALAEAIALFGFVLAFLNQSAFVALPYAGAGLLLQIFVGPLFGKFYRR